MFKKITLLLCFLCICVCFAQEQIQYSTIDTLNVAYRQKLKELYNERAAETLQGYNTFMDKGFRKLLIASYNEYRAAFLDNVDKGIFFYDELYQGEIDAIYQKILQGNLQYNNNLTLSKILLSFDVSPNAYAMGDGFVVVHLPLLAKLNNRYELAFILCHEIAHNLLSHPQNGLKDYVAISSSDEIKQKSREIEKSKYNRGESASKLYRKIVYSGREKHRGIEFQADSLGFILFRNAFGGAESAALKSFETLDSIDSEKDSLQPSDYEKLFSSPAQPFNYKWIASDELSNYKYNKTHRFWQIDSLKTHPDCIDRALRLKKTFTISNETDSIDVAGYSAISTRACMDNVLGLYVIKEYGKSLYEALLLLKDMPDNSYLRKMVHSNLVKISMSQKTYTMNKYVETVNPNYSYSYNRFLCFIRQLRKSEMNQIINQYQ